MKIELRLNKIKSTHVNTIRTPNMQCMDRSSRDK